MLVVDVETTGIDENKNSIVSVGGVIIPKIEEDTIKYLYNEARVWPGAEISDRTLEVNGFTREAITSDQTKLTQREMLEQLVEFADMSEDITIWGHNPRFDVNFINASLKREGLDFRFSYHTLDQHTLACVRHLDNQQQIPLKDKKSILDGDAIMTYVGIPQEPTPHNALNGAKWEAEAIYRMLYGKNFHPDFKKFPVPNYLKRN